MNYNFIDLTGKCFGRLRVLERASNGNRHTTRWHCVCSCGRKIITYSSSLLHQGTISCGCFAAEILIARNLKHGHTRRGKISKTYKVWLGMNERCSNPHHKSWKHYGGRGIKVCQRWKTFYSFFEDMGISPKGMMLDRIDNDGDYTKENCRWATYEEQMNNKRTNNVVVYDGKQMTITQWCRKLKLNYPKVHQRIIKDGWSVEKAFNDPRCKIL